MTKISNITGFYKAIFNVKLKITVFFHFIPQVLNGNLSLKRFVLFLKRLLIFLNTIQHNKFVKIDGKTRLDLYVPGFPSEAFYTACKKFMMFEEKMSCTTVLISITSACKYHCSHCYQKLDKGKDVDIDILMGAVKKLQDQGISFFNIEGGEPFLVFDRLKRICSTIDDRSEIWINSTGMGITRERLMELKKMNVTALMFSLHSTEPEVLNQFMGSDLAWDTLTNAVNLCHEVGIAVAFNTCLMKEDFYNGTFEKIMEAAKVFKASIVQIIKPKPSGGWLAKEDIEFTQKDVEYVKQRVNQYNTKREFREYPSISAQMIEEDPEVFGCTAGGIDRFYINAKGDVQPCEFLNLSFGNIALQPFEEIYKQMRDCFKWGGECALCEKYSKEVYTLYHQNQLSSLPLPPELSEKIYSRWNRGEKTKLYEKLEKLK